MQPPADYLRALPIIGATMFTAPGMFVSIFGTSNRRF
jgi:hypothetical protein